MANNQNQCFFVYMLNKRQGNGKLINVQGKNQQQTSWQTMFKFSFGNKFYVKWIKGKMFIILNENTKPKTHQTNIYTI